MAKLGVMFDVTIVWNAKCRVLCESCRVNVTEIGKTVALEYYLSGLM